MSPLIANLRDIVLTLTSSYSMSPYLPDEGDEDVLVGDISNSVYWTPCEMSVDHTNCSYHPSEPVADQTGFVYGVIASLHGVVPEPSPGIESQAIRSPCDTPTTRHTLREPSLRDTCSSTWPSTLKLPDISSNASLKDYNAQFRGCDVRCSGSCCIGSSPLSSIGRFFFNPTELNGNCSSPKLSLYDVMPDEWAMEDSALDSACAYSAESMRKHKFKVAYKSGDLANNEKDFQREHWFGMMGYPFCLCHLCQTLWTFDELLTLALLCARPARERKPRKRLIKHLLWKYLSRQRLQK